MIENNLTASKLTAGTEQMYVEFHLGESSFGIPVENVNEIILPVNVTPIPRSHSYVEGITDIRGSVLPVIDLAKTLSLENMKEDGQDRFIVCEWAAGKMIFHVTSVEQIISVNEIEQPGDMGASNEFVNGVVRLDDKMILLLDFEKLIHDMLS